MFVKALSNVNVRSLTPLLVSLSLSSDLLDLQPANDEASNQCDSPVRSLLPRGRIVFDGHDEEEPADDSGFHHGDWDVTAAKEQPEECTPAEYKSAVPVVHNSVARFQQFQLQIPSNHARTPPPVAQ